jgi:LytS/YehU family sensor histidine kinase
MRELLKITDILDLDILQNIQDSFSDATGFAAVTVDYKGDPVTKYSNFTKYCRTVRTNKRCLDYCCQSDAHGGIEAARSGKPSIYICHGGLVDFAVPIMVRGNYLGAILAGQVKISEEDKKKLSIGFGELTDFSSRKDILKMYDNIPETPIENVYAGANLMFTIANYLVEKEMRNIMQSELNEKNLKLMEEVKARSALETTLKEADLKALQSQINPHFLFNVLNTIGRLALLEGAERTQEMIYSFSDMLRYTLKKDNSKMVTIDEEVEHVRNYLGIQKMRMGERLKYSITKSESAENAMCPFMIIQPFVENSIVHAIEPDAAGGEITINIGEADDYIVISIKDDGCGIPGDKINKILEGTHQSNEKTSAGIGINNVNERLIYYYGEDSKVEIESGENEGTRVILRIPSNGAAGRGLNV